MKQLFLRLCLLVVACAAGTAASAQALPNGTLETWETRNGNQTPTSWFTLDDFAAALFPGLPLAPGTTSRSTDKHGGTYAAKLENKNNLLLGPVPGMLGLGTTINVSAGRLGGVPFEGRPARMEFYYKLTGAGATNDSAAVQVLLTKNINGQQTLVASGDLLLTPAANYTLATIPLDYGSAAVSDSIQILFLSSTRDQPIVGTALFIDDVVMTGTVTQTVDPVRNAAVTVFPNPSADGLFTLSTARDASWMRAPYTVTDLTGRVVVRQGPANAAGTRTVDLRGHRAGVYTLRLETPEGPVVHKLLIP